MGEVKSLVNYTIDRNLKLEEAGKTPISVCIEGEAGVGKTSILQNIAAEREMTCTKISLHELDEAGDLCGYPIMEYECQVARRVKDSEGNVKTQILPNTVWINAKQLENNNTGLLYKQTGKTRMGYAKPAWVPEYNEKGNLVILDDFGRCNSTLAQAVMELILTQGYVSWKLPKKTSLFLTSNPDNGLYNISSSDPAQRTRFLCYTVDWDLNDWMQWAEKDGMDGRCINFVSSYSQELFGSDDDGNRICNPRSFTMFSNMISGIDDWDNAENQNFISLIAKGCFQDEGGRFAKMFRSFLMSKMHLLIQPKEMLNGDWKDVKEKLEKTIYDSDGSPRPDISTLLERRFSNYVGAWLSSDATTPIKKVEDRIVNFIENEEKGGLALFSQDSLYHMIKTITSNNKRQTNKLMFNPKIAKVIA
jgi:hypothetical protein